MTSGTIHAVAADLFVIEGGGLSPSAAVYRSGTQLCLLDTGTGQAQRAAIRAVVASYSEIEEVALLNSGNQPRPEGNDDLLTGLAVSRRRHLHPGGAGLVADGSQPVPIEDYETLGGTGSVAIGSQLWPGWQFGSIDVLQVDSADEGRVGFHIAGCRALIVPHLLLGSEQAGGPGLAVDTADRLLRVLDDGAVAVVSAGSGAPMAVVECRDLIRTMMAARGHPQPDSRQIRPRTDPG